MIRMMSMKDHLYAGKRLKAGDKFVCRGESDARLLRALGRAIDYTAPPEPVHVPAKKYTPPGTYATAAVVAAPEHVFAPPVVVDTSAAEFDDVPSFIDGGHTEDAATKPKRAYRRRDMKADAE